MGVSRETLVPFGNNTDLVPSRRSARTRPKEVKGCTTGILEEVPVVGGRALEEGSLMDTGDIRLPEVEM